jgi:hypothetical protein
MLLTLFDIWINDRLVVRTAASFPRYTVLQVSCTIGLLSTTYSLNFFRLIVSSAFHYLIYYMSYYYYQI